LWWHLYDRPGEFSEFGETPLQETMINHIDEHSIGKLANELGCTDDFKKLIPIGSIIDKLSKYR
jgi:hypothetical protein